MKNQFGKAILITGMATSSAGAILATLKDKEFHADPPIVVEKQMITPNNYVYGNMTIPTMYKQTVARLTCIF